MKHGRRSGWRWTLIATALLAPSAAFAQASPSPYTSATRYDAAGRVTGTISADPDGPSGPLPFLAVRNSYDAAGRLVKVETGTLAAWQSESVAPAAWTGFTVNRTAEALYDAMGRKTRDTVREGAAGAVRTMTQTSYDSSGRPDCTAVRMNPADFAAPPASACTQGTGGADNLHEVFSTREIRPNPISVPNNEENASNGVGTGSQTFLPLETLSLPGQGVGGRDITGSPEAIAAHDLLSHAYDFDQPVVYERLSDGE